MLHETLSELNENEYEKIFEELNNVFDKKNEGKKRKKRRKVQILILIQMI